MRSRRRSGHLRVVSFRLPGGGAKGVKGVGVPVVLVVFAAAAVGDAVAEDDEGAGVSGGPDLDGAHKVPAHVH
ncbi:hypothetical protein IMZ48_20785 [Candidatus Bathyarchaeota archaeon]|nr:hypothetical protein [Candidatus Bathyarchaeota archaeon]